VEEALQREAWSEPQWKHWRRERLAFILHRAATRVPYYREHWARRRAAGDRSSLELLENWPVLEKEQLRRAPRAFVADDRSPATMFHEHTSGSTGTPVSLWFSRDTVRFWYALFEARWRRWYDVSRFDNWAILGGKLVTPISQTRPPFWIWNAAMRQLYMSSYHLSPEFIPYYLEALKRYRIEYLWGYTSSLYTIAQEALRHGRAAGQLKVVIANAEPLFEHQRAAIAAAFHCPVRETYGMSEIVAAASECQCGVLHLWPEVGVIEIAPGGTSEGQTIEGELVCTGLCNPDMPLIRYRIGDRASLPTKPGNCACNRTLPVLTRIEGRSDDVLFGSDGRAIGRLDPVFKGDFLVCEAQIVQESLEFVRLVYVPAEGCTEQHIRALANQIRARMGSVRVEAESVSSIPRGPNNKFRAVISKLPPEQRYIGKRTHA
jgi:phenylacetate-CoA ligase